MSMIGSTKLVNCTKYNGVYNREMPRSRKRHHSRSRSKTRSRSPSREVSHDKMKKPSSHEKDGKRRRLDDIIDSPQQKRSLSFDDEEQLVEDVEQGAAENSKTSELENSNDDGKAIELDNPAVVETSESNVKEVEPVKSEPSKLKNEESGKKATEEIKNPESGNCVQECDKKTEAMEETESVKDQTTEDDVVVVPDSDTIQIEVIYDKKDQLATPKKALTPKQLQKKLESEKKRMQRQQEKEEREKQRQDEKAKLLAEKQKLKEQREAEKQKQLELKQKEKEIKDEQRKKEKEEKEQKRKEKEEQEAQKRKEKEEERLKKQQEIEEKKQKEEEKKQKTAALFINFFKKTEAEERELKTEKVNSNFMPFEVKSDMRLPPLRRAPLSADHTEQLDCLIQNQDETMSYLKDLKCGKIQVGKSTKTWPYEDPEEEEVTIVEEDKNLGETIGEDASVVHKMKAKFLFFHENRRPAYFGTWRKKSKFINPRKPFREDPDHFNYEEDSDDDWEEEEQGESLDVSGDDDEKDNENEEDDYEVDNEFFVPHGHLSDDEIDDEENARLSPESLKQKLKLLKDEFEEDMKSKTHKLKPRSIGGVWINRQGDNLDDAIYRYLQPFAMIVKGTIEIKKRSEVEKKKTKPIVGGELSIEHIPSFLKIIHGNINKKQTVIEEFLTLMASNGFSVEVSKNYLIRFLKKSATYRRCQENGPMKNKFGWFVNDDIKEKYHVNLELSKTEN